MCACTETDVRESANDCILASGEGHGCCGETFQPIYIVSPISLSVEHPVFVRVHMSHLFKTVPIIWTGNCVQPPTTM
jgi:hypothetical protein